MLRSSVQLLKYSNKVTLRYHDAVRGKDPNIGKFDKDDPNVTVGKVGSGACGDMLSFSLKIKDGRIQDVKYLVFGCGSAIASSSYAAEYIKGKTLEQASRLTNRQIAAELSLPPVKLHCSLLAEEAIKSAINNLNKKTKVTDPL